MSNIKARIANILNNQVKHSLANSKEVRGTPAIQQCRDQIVKLNEYACYYLEKPSNRGGTIKPKSALSAVNALRSLGLYLQDKPYENATTKDLENWVASLNKHAPAGKNLFITHMRSFYKWLNNSQDKEVPLVLKSKLLKPVIMKDGKVRPESLLADDELVKILRVSNTRDKAIIMTASEGGMRAGEMASCNVSSLTFDEYGCKLTPLSSKTNVRPVRLVESTPFLQEWVKAHPNPQPNSPLFVTRSGERLDSSRFNTVLQANAIKAKVAKHVHFHLLRHLSVTKLARQGLGLELNARSHGITSRTLEQVYLHFSDQDVDDAVLKAKGNTKSAEELLAERESQEKLNPKKCPYCAFLNHFDSLYCKNCSRPCDMKVFVENDEKLADLHDDMKEMARMQEQMMKAFMSAGLPFPESLTKKRIVFVNKKVE